MNLKRIAISNLQLFLLVPLGLFCQENTTVINTDSLMDQIRDQPDNTEKAANYYTLHEAFYQMREMDKALDYADSALALYRKFNSHSEEAVILYSKALTYYKMGDLNSVWEFLDRSIEISDSVGELLCLAKGKKLYGELLSKSGRASESIPYLESSLEYYKSAGDSGSMIRVHHAMGNSCTVMAEYDMAALNYHKALELSIALGYEKYYGAIYLQLGKIYYSLSPPDYDKAGKYLELSIQYFTLHDDKEGLGIAYNHLGNLSNFKGNKDSALYFFNEARKEFLDIKDKQGLADVFNNIAEVYDDLGRYEEALDHYFKALSFYREQDITEGIIVSRINIADVYSRQDKYRLAHIYYDSATSLARDAGINYHLVNALSNKAEAYYRQGEYKKGYEYLQQFINLRDSVYKLEKDERIAELELKYEKEQLTSKNLRLEREALEWQVDLEKKTSQRNIFLFSGIGITLLILFILVVYRQKATKQRIIAENRIRQLEEEKKMLAARALVEGQEDERKRIARELHDGLGVLLSTVRMQFTSIKDKSPENQPLIERAAKLLEQASGDVRKISHNMMPGLLTRLGLFEAVGDLMDKVGETEGMEVIADIPEDAERLPENKEIMIFRIIQEMVNNTLKHASARLIELKMKLSRDKLEISFRDDGKGFNVDEKLESKSIGLQSIHSRVNFLNGRVDLDSGPGKGTRYFIVVPVG